MVAPAPAPKSGPRSGLPAGRAAARPLAEPVARALRDNESLASLLARLAQSQARWAAVAPLLTSELAGAAREGPLDDKAWVILAEHAAAAALNG